MQRIGILLYMPSAGGRRRSEFRSESGERAHTGARQQKSESLFDMPYRRSDCCSRAREFREDQTSGVLVSGGSKLKFLGQIRETTPPLSLRPAPYLSFSPSPLPSALPRHSRRILNVVRPATTVVSSRAKKDTAPRRERCEGEGGGAKKRGERERDSSVFIASAINNSAVD